MIKIIAWIYIALVMGTLSILMIRKADKYFWKGVGYGILIAVVYAGLIISGLIVTDHIGWRL